MSNGARRPESPERPVVFRQHHYWAGLGFPVLCMFVGMVGLVRGGIVNLFLGAWLLLSVWMLVLFPWRIRVFADEVEVRFGLRPRRLVPRSSATVVAGGKRSGALLLAGPRRRIRDTYVLLGPFQRSRTGPVVRRLAEHGYRVSEEMPPR